MTVFAKPHTAEVGADALKERISEQLERTRARTLALIEPLSDDALNRVHDTLMSPIAWDLGHIANFEELWLVRRLGRGAQAETLAEVYDPFNTRRSERGALHYLRGEECLDYMRTVRERTLARLEEVDVSDQAEPLTAGGFVYDMIARHEQQHSETILQTLQTMTQEPYSPMRVDLPAAAHGKTDAVTEKREGMVLVPAGPFEMGANGDWFAYDNERASHSVDVATFWIDAKPATNAQFLEFIEDGGYERPDLWSSEGWSWREREGITLPRYWERDGGGFQVRSFARFDAIDPSKPVCHVSWYEADAYARYAGKRLPTEAEWEKAARWDEAGTRGLRYPWGSEPFTPARANLDQLAFETAPAGAYPGGASACGAEQMIGDVWEWTASGFDAYPGFRPFPYREYSEAFFGGPFKALRGGAWATQPEAVSSTFRNWDYPDRRQIFAGFRCARDEAGQRATRSKRP